MTAPPPIEHSLILLENVSRFYGEVLGVNRVTLSIPPGITSMVGPNGSGKTTLMNLMTGLVRPTRGTIKIAGVTPQEPEKLFRILGYSTQFDSFPKGLTGFQFVYPFLRLFGWDHAEMRKDGVEIHRARQHGGSGESQSRRATAKGCGSGSSWRSRSRTIRGF